MRAAAQGRSRRFSGFAGLIFDYLICPIADIGIKPNRPSSLAKLFGATAPVSSAGADDRPVRRQARLAQMTGADRPPEHPLPVSPALRYGAAGRDRIST